MDIALVAIAAFDKARLFRDCQPDARMAQSPFPPVASHFPLGDHFGFRGIRRHCILLLASAEPIVAKAGGKGKGEDASSIVLDLFDLRSMRAFVKLENLNRKRVCGAHHFAFVDDFVDIVRNSAATVRPSRINFSVNLATSDGLAINLIASARIHCASCLKVRSSYS
jgi:hypothetical protein